VPELREQNCRHRREPIAWVVALLAAVTHASAARAAVVADPVVAAADAFVTTGPTNNLVNNNYGGAGALSVAPAGSAKGEFQSVLRFDLSPARATFDAAYGAGKWSVQSVSLQLTAAPANNAIFNASAAGSFAARWMQNDSWVEGTGNPNAPTADGVTFASLPSYLSPSDQLLGSFAYTGATSGSTVYNLSLPPSFTADVSAGGLVSLQLLASGAGGSYLVDSRNFGTASARPTLAVTAVPEPACAGVLSFVTLGLLTRRSRV
jgi:hypothetical protein